MIEALAPLFIGDFSSYRDTLVLHDDPRPSVPLRELLSAEGLPALLARFGEAYADGDRRALLSQWSKHYFVRLIPPVVAAALVLNRRLPLDLDDIEVVLDEEHLPQAFKLRDAGGSFTPDDPFERFAHLQHDHLAPLIQAFTAQVKIAPKVLWSNAGNYFEWILTALGKVLPAPMLADGFSLLQATLQPDGGRNPLYQPVRYVELQGAALPWRQRRVCCIRYLLPELELCKNCPLLDEPPVAGDSLE
ncbi:siderophore-iron reductase FhuF [Pseudomonas sp. PDM11]|uniref:siderophore-iron reductase FhuF n=1 Tax=Pseudomonas sp. PDM11 TaxID=2769309 RepID=UPI0017824F00|nr:siderophore-iron reductase FhuF [Pseudomonas sp. PDM11]MBD9399582.1 siderophore-iron reductase FhuF [Pseudomonas sp. PDM11]